MSPVVKRVSPVLVLGLGIGSYLLLDANKPEPDKREDVARPVSVFVEAVTRAPVQLNVTTQGEVRSRVAIDMVAQVGGRIESVSPEFTEGGTVAPGEPLLVIEDRDYNLSLNQAQARVAAARVAVELALADADVARKQLRNTTNPSPLALKKPQVAEAQAGLKAAQADLEQAQLNLQRTRVSLPFVGRIEATYVDLGTFVAPGTPLGRAFATDRVEVRLPITDSQLASLGLPIGYVAAPGEQLRVDFSARVAGALQHWSGHLVRLDASVDSATRLLYAIAEVNDPYGAEVSERGMPLAVGLFVGAVIHGRRLENAMQLPSIALRAGDRVYVVDEDGLLDVRAVDVAHHSGNFAVINGGVEVGDQVVVSTIRNPIPGMSVQPMEAASSAVVSADSADDSDADKKGSG